jgi:hypothetical protein
VPPKSDGQLPIIVVVRARSQILAKSSVEIDPTVGVVQARDPTVGVVQARDPTVGVVQARDLTDEPSIGMRVGPDLPIPVPPKAGAQPKVLVHHKIPDPRRPIPDQAGLPVVRIEVGILAMREAIIGDPVPNLVEVVGMSP